MSMPGNRGNSVASPLINSAFQKAIQAERTRTRPPFQGLQFLSLSFEGLRYKDALLWLGGWFGWLG